jgi:hypothetical protein
MKKEKNLTQETVQPKDGANEKRIESEESRVKYGIEPSKKGKIQVEDIMKQ